MRSNPSLAPHVVVPKPRSTPSSKLWRSSCHHPTVVPSSGVTFGMFTGWMLCSWKPCTRPPPSHSHAITHTRQCGDLDWHITTSHEPSWEPGKQTAHGARPCAVQSGRSGWGRDCGASAVAGGFVWDRGRLSPAVAFPCTHNVHSVTTTHRPAKQHNTSTHPPSNHCKPAAASASLARSHLRRAMSSCRLIAGTRPPLRRMVRCRRRWALARSESDWPLYMALRVLPSGTSSLGHTRANTCQSGCAT